MRHSAAVILTRSGSHGPEIYLVERAPQLRFFGGYWAFPGGVVDEVDQVGGVSPEVALERCALRELFEETGLLPSPLEAAIPAPRRLALRERLVDRDSDAGAWGEFISAVDESRVELRRVTTITTPSFSPLRHQTPFFHLGLPKGQEPHIVPGELTRGRFWRVEELFANWRAGDLSVVPPALYLLEFLLDGDLETFFSAARRGGEALQAGQLHRAYLSPGVMTAPLRTPTLPPATTTNTVMVGEDRVYIVDPATPELSERERLFETLDRWRNGGRELAGVLLTHHHHDHVGAVRETSERYGIPVFGHAETLSRLSLEGLELRELVDGEELELGRSPDGRDGWRLRCHWTPGHASGHLVFIENRYRTAIVGDLVSTLSTIVIDPPEGHMRTYIDSLKSIADLDIGVLIPAHGPGQRLGKQTIEYHLARRVQREAKLVGALNAAPQSVDTLLPVVYGDAAEEILPLAMRSMIAGLDKLREDGLAVETPAGWSLAPA